MKYPICVKCSKADIRKTMRMLKRNGVRGIIVTQDSNALILKGTVSGYRYNKVASLCKDNHIQYYIDNSYGKRSASYRRAFFESNKPVLGNYYFCAYCGKLVRKDRVTVDHLYPVHEAGRNIRLQKKLKRKGINDINDPENLVPACMKCNQMKSARMGKWIIRGRIGRCQALWYARHAIRITAVVMALSMLVRYIGL